ncbi:hypothetical protein DPV74_12320 [Burkholderia sp. HAN2018]|nr:hypothetical protein [Burkholderia sp. HAN2018]
MDTNKLTDIVNQSGFPLQMGVVAQIEKTKDSHGWSVRFVEHAWKNQFDGDGGFIDIVLEDRHRTTVMVVECKRVLESSWIFLKANTGSPLRRHAKAWVTHFSSNELKHAGWTDLTLDPSTPESAFCVVHGQDSKSRPMLERVAAELVSATEAYAIEDQAYMAKQFDLFRMCFGVIVTTATLKVCTFNPEEVSVTDGKVASTEFLEVPFLRFRKQLSARPLDSQLTLAGGFYDVARAKEHTVFVVNAASLAQFLSEFEVSNDAVRRFV